MEKRQYEMFDGSIDKAAEIIFDVLEKINGGVLISNLQSYVLLSAGIFIETVHFVPALNELAEEDKVKFWFCIIGTSADESIVTFVAAKA